MFVLMSDAAVFRVPPGFEAEWAGASASATEVVINVIRVGDLLARCVDALAREHGLPSATAVIPLEVLRGEGGPLQPSIIAERCFLSRPALSGVLDSLEKRNLVRRRPHPQTRRGVLVEITKEGVAALRALLPKLHRAEAQWIAELSERQRSTLLSAVGTLHQRLSAEE
jgi:DNA-binding MarR family transcriptional regulator